MISIKNLNMSYPLENETVTVLRDINLDVPDGQSVAIVGPSGSGKTTLLLLLAGLDKPMTGSIEVADTPLSELSADELADLRRDKLGIIFQSFHLVPSLTALANVALPLELAGTEGARDRADAMLKSVGLGERERHYPSQLSGGEQQRVAIARALVHKPSLVLADEPTGNLDKRTGQHVSDTLFQLQREVGSTMLMVTHDEKIAGRCNRLFQLDEGKLIEKESDAVFS